MTRSRSIAIVQTCPLAGDVQANLDEHIRLARLAATEGALIVVFPELSLTGYEPALAESLAFSECDRHQNQPELFHEETVVNRFILLGALTLSLACTSFSYGQDYQKIADATAWSWS